MQIVPGTSLWDLILPGRLCHPLKLSFSKTLRLFIHSLSHSFILLFTVRTLEGLTPTILSSSNGRLFLTCMFFNNSSISYQPRNLKNIVPTLQQSLISLFHPLFFCNTHSPHSIIIPPIEYGYFLLDFRFSVFSLLYIAPCR